jgi:hypothetical protein
MTYGTIEELAAHGGLPGIIPDEPDDIYIAAASFEPRSIALTDTLSDGYQALWGFVYVNTDFLAGTAAATVQNTLNGLRDRLQARCKHVNVIGGNWEQADIQVRALRDAFDLVQPNATVERITIDATTFNRESLIVCLALLRSQFPHSRVRLLYVSPERHGTWLSRGFRKVRNIVGFAGIQQPSRATVLFVLSGFEADRTIKIIEEYEPNRVFLGIGDPPTVPGFLQRNISEHKLVLSRTDVEEFRFPADSIQACAAALEGRIDVVARFANIVIAPMSTKLSTVGAFIVSERHPEIQLAYCLPGEYNTSDYSAGTGRVFVEELY